MRLVESFEGCPAAGCADRSPSVREQGIGVDHGIDNEPKSGPKPKEPLPYARLHDLRHIHATTLLLAGVPVHVVAARLGHADPAITLRVYAHVIRAAEARAAEVFTGAIRSVGNAC